MDGREAVDFQPVYPRGAFRIGEYFRPEIPGLNSISHFKI